MKVLIKIKFLRKLRKKINIMIAM